MSRRRRRSALGQDRGHALVTVGKLSGATDIALVSAFDADGFVSDSTDEDAWQFADRHGLRSASLSADGPPFASVEATATNSSITGAVRAAPRSPTRRPSPASPLRGRRVTRGRGDGKLALGVSMPTRLRQSSPCGLIAPHRVAAVERLVERVRVKAPCILSVPGAQLSPMGRQVGRGRETVLS